MSGSSTLTFVIQAQNQASAALAAAGASLTNLGTQMKAVTAASGAMNAAQIQVININNQLASASAGTAAQVNTLANSHKNLGHNAGATRETLVLLHETIQGRYKNLLGSLIVMSEYLSQSSQTFNKLKSAVFSATGGFVALGVAAVGAFVYAGVQAEDHTLQIIKLQDQLAITNQDYVQLAASAKKAADAVSRTPGFDGSKADALTAARNLAPALAPGTTDTEKTLEDLIKISSDLANLMGTKLPEEAKKLAASLKDPTDAAKKLAEEGYKGFTDAVVRNIQILQDSGKTVQAQTAFIAGLKNSIADQTRTMTPFSEALRKLADDFRSAGQEGESFWEIMGDAALTAATKAVNAIHYLMGGLQQARENMDDFRGWLGDLSSQPANQQAGTPARAQERGGILKQLTDDALTAVRQAAQQTGLDSAFIGQMVNIESSGGRNLSTSSAGAMGPAQIQPKTFAEMQAKYGFSGSINDYNTNVLAGSYYLKDQLGAFGSPADAYLAYHNGPGAVGKPFGPQTQAAVDSMINNYHGSGYGPSNMRGSYTDRAAADDADFASSGGDNAADRVRQQGIDAALKVNGGKYGADYQNQDIDAQIDRFESERSGLEKNTTLYNLYTAAIQKLRAEKEALIDPITKDITTSQREAAQTALSTEALRSYTKEMDAFKQSAADKGITLDQNQINEKSIAIQEKMSNEFKAHVADINAQTEAEKALLAVQSSGDSVTAHVKDAQQALQDARKSYIDDTSPAFKKAVEQETAALDAHANVMAQATLQQDLLNQATEIAQQQATNASYSWGYKGSSPITAATNAANLKVTSAGLGGTDAGNQYVANATQLAQLKQAGDQQKQVIDEVTNFGQSSFDKLGQSITNAFTQGGVSLKSFASVAKSALDEVINELLKLSVINPLLNGLFGGSRTTIGQVGGLFGGAADAGSAAIDDSVFSSATSFFAGGGVMTRYGSIPLRRYSTGGVASSPQLAMFGEGSKNEAYVPLPDGRSIPVTMRGGNGGSNLSSTVQVNVSVGGGGSSKDSSDKAGAATMGNTVANTVKGYVVSILNDQLRAGGALNPAVAR